MLFSIQAKGRRMVIWFMLLLIPALTVTAQTKTEGSYLLHVNYVDKDSSFKPQELKLQDRFLNQAQCMSYINKLPGLLHAKGYPTASIDSLQYDSTAANLQLFLGRYQPSLQLRSPVGQQKAFDAIGFLVTPVDTAKTITIAQLQALKENLLGYFENVGYPFASVSLDSIRLTSTSMSAVLAIQTGPLYRIDSIRVKGDVKISGNFLQRYLQIPNGSIYNRQKLEKVSTRLLELPYLREQQPSELSMLGNGSILNLYLLAKKSSQVNFLVGVLPANSQTNKLQLTGDVNLQLRNALGSGETILLNWQQLQLSSPRINLGFQQPYIFKSAFGLDFAFDLFKKDSSFLQLNALLGVQYLLSANQSGKLFFQNQSSFLLGSGVDTNQVKRTKQLPINIDVRSTNVGVDYELNNTNYRFNPIRGTEFKINTAVGIKTITPNNEIIKLTDAGFDFKSLYDSLQLRTHQLRARGAITHYIPTGKRSTVKTAVNAGLFYSPNMFRNELFQIGGYKLLRGFDEESIYATRYGVATVEYRNLVAQNSYLFSFVDVGWVRNLYQQVNVQNSFVSGGLGLVFETKAGVLNMSFAIGKRNDVKLDLRQAAKIHFGYINYF